MVGPGAAHTTTTTTSGARPQHSILGAQHAILGGAHPASPSPASLARAWPQPPHWPAPWRRRLQPRTSLAQTLRAGPAGRPSGLCVRGTHRTHEGWGGVVHVTLVSDGASRRRWALGRRTLCVTTSTPPQMPMPPCNAATRLRLLVILARLVQDLARPLHSPAHRAESPPRRACAGAGAWGVGWAGNGA